MKRDWLVAALVVSLVFNAAVIGAFAYGWVKRPAVRPELCPLPAEVPAEKRMLHGQRLARIIGVPRERSIRFAAVVADSSAETRAIRLEIHRSRGELIALVESPAPDSAAIMAKVDELSRLQGDLEKRVVGRLLYAGSFLTQEERGRFMRLIRHRCLPCEVSPRPAPAGPPGEREDRR